MQNKTTISGDEEDCKIVASSVPLATPKTQRESKQDIKKRIVSKTSPGGRKKPRLEDLTGSSISNTATLADEWEIRELKRKLEDLQAKLEKKKAKIGGLKDKVSGLKKENKQIRQDLVEEQKSLAKMKGLMEGRGLFES
jgi:chromosome segregation ATPase